jgi:formylglycine-generating enzyme required for sulfatase activity
MKPLLQRPLAWGISLAGAAAVLALVAADPTPGKVPDKLPKVEPLTQKGYAEALPGSEVKFDMVPIPGGVYLMGSPEGEKGRGEDEGPQHPVQIKPFWMGKCEVTWDEYDLYWKSQKEGAEEKPPAKVKDPADAVSRPTPPYADETFGHGREEHPVLCITHHAAMKYCEWLSLKTGKTYRLPTEAEWEWAARAGTSTAYFFGDDAKALDDYAWYAGNDPDELTQPVGKKKPNPWGLYDIYGNVAEWCLDHYQKDYYSKFLTDRITLEPVQLPTEARFPHVARGGSWADKADRLRSAARRGSDKTWIKLDPQRPQSIWWLTSADFVGFRVVRPVEELDNLKGLRSKVTRESLNYPQDYKP